MVKKQRNQPFLILFFSAVMAFKRIARTMKIVFERRLLKKEKGVANTMKSLIIKSHDTVRRAYFGANVITVTGSELRHQRYLSSIRNAVKRRQYLKQKMLDKMAKEHPHLLEKEHAPIEAKVDFTTMKRGFPNFAERLRKSLIISKIEPDHVDTGEDITPVDANAINFDCLMDKNNKMEGTATEVREYVAGSCIYYGSTITIQARHGGYMSYNDAKNLKASAHKVMQHTKFVIYKAKDPAFVGAVLYGDAVILQAGQHELLGAQYGGGPIIANEKRKIRPSLINFRRENAYKAAQVIVLGSIAFMDCHNGDISYMMQ